jgi:hypothetical protein
MRIPNPVKTLPPGYHEVHYMKVTERGRLFWLNVLSLIPMFASGLIVSGGLILYQDWGAPLVIDRLPNHIPFLPGILLVLLVLPLHEWIHGRAITRVGHRPRYGVKLMVLYATSDGALFRRSEFLWIALAPLVVISTAGLIMMLFLPAGLSQWVVLGVMMNAAGSIGDLWMAAVALRFAPSVLIRDEADSMRIFAQAKS